MTAIRRNRFCRRPRRRPCSRRRARNLLGLIFAAALALLCSAARAHDDVISGIHTLAENAGRLSWVGHTIVFDRMDENEYFHVWTMKDDGSAQMCLTCGKPELPMMAHKGNPDMDPTGHFIIFQGQNEFRGLGKVTKYFANPGSGINNNLWIMDARGKLFRQLSEVPERIGGTLHPHFSPDGKYLLWTERISAWGGAIGKWTLKLAKFVNDPERGPVLNDIQSFQPGEQQQFYEPHGFSPDGEKIIFSGNLSKGQKITAIDIYTFDLKTNELKNLTGTLDEWDEHAHFSPSGKHIVWMSSRGMKMPTQPAEIKTDYWIMDSDGGNKRRLTFFNEPGNPDYIAGGVAAADFAWNADGTKLAGVLIADVRTGASKIVEIDFKEGQ